MRLISWNCQGAFRKKYHLLDAMNADLLIIQECEDPAQWAGDYQKWAGDYTWAGYDNGKGVGIFPRRGQTMKRLPWPDHGQELFLPAVIDDFTLLGVWTQHAKPAKFSYIGQLWHYLNAHKADLGPNTIIAGDFNSSAIWDKPRQVWSHANCVAELEQLGLHSLYHRQTGEVQGHESQPTYFQNRNKGKPFHIDYIFAHDAQISKGFTATIGPTDYWLTVSDHLPIIADLMCPTYDRDCKWRDTLCPPEAHPPP